MSGTSQVIAAVTAVLIFFVGIFVGSLIEANLVTFSFKDYTPAIATLFAAFFGASYAFKLNLEKEERAARKKNIVAGNLVVFNLTRMLNILLDYQKQIVEPIREKELAFIEMKPTLHLVEDDINLDLDSVAFLFDSEDANLLGVLSVEKSKFKRTIDSINLRSQFHIYKLQPILERDDVKEGENHPLSQFEQTLGPQLYATMQSSTKQIIENVDSTISSMQKTSKDLTAMLKKIYPNERIISTKITDNS